jgi:small conductance mechanosensitive channel
MEHYIDWTTQLTVAAVRSGIRIALIVLLTFLIFRLIRVVAKKLSAMVDQHELDSEAEKRAETLGLVIRHTLNVLLVVVAAITILSELGIEIGPILAAAGIVGVAVGFGSQSLIKDVINGFFILANDQIRVGDVVQIAGKSGAVEQVNLKMTVLRDISGNVHFIPNGSIDIVTNMTKAYSRYLFEIGITYSQDIDKAIKVINNAFESLQEDPEFKQEILEPLEILGLDRFADSSVIIRARITTLPGKQWKTGREFNRLIKQRFDAEGIEFPFPTRTVYQYKSGE